MDKPPHDDRPVDPRIEIGHVQLAVADIDRAVAFYQDALGFEITPHSGPGVLLGAGAHHPLILLNSETAGLAGAPASAPCRFAIRYQDRKALGRALGRLTGAGTALEGALDHGVRESLYLRDPEGHFIELYYDRPREAWPVEAASHPLDIELLRASAEAAPDTAARPDQAPVLSEDTRERLREVRLRLLNLHKVLLEDTRTAYELDRGRIASNSTLLQLVISDPWFAWLHPLSELVVRIDETMQPESPATETDGAMLLDQVERLLSPAQSVEPFAQRYYEALQRQPAVIMAHGDVRRILKQTK